MNRKPQHLAHLHPPAAFLRRDATISDTRLSRKEFSAGSLTVGWWILVRPQCIAPAGEYLRSSGVASCPNQARARGAGQSQLRKKISLSVCSGNAWSLSRAASSRRAGCPIASPARNGRQTSSSPASASRQRGRFSRSTARGLSGANSSSGGGLGIQQPGSMTRGGSAATPAPSGRARDRAICPAVARSNERRAA